MDATIDAVTDIPKKRGDIDWDGLRRARRALIGNPFDVNANALTDADGWFSTNAELVPSAVQVLLERKEAVEARKVVLAAAHAYARSGDVGRHQQLRELVGAPLAKDVNLSRDDLTRLGLALWRFQLALARLVGSSPALNRIRKELWTLCFGEHLFDSLEHEPAVRSLNVVVLGETGTGKELVAEVLQAGSFAREQPPVISVNCAALPRELAEAELFGFAAGAHSTARQSREGKLVAADGGTLFLDEVADLPPEVQVKLLSVVQNARVTPLGTNAVRTVDVRYVAATSRPLNTLVKEDKFRRDLYERLAGHVIEVPPLRERPEDVVAIGQQLLRTLRRDAPARAIVSSVVTLFGHDADKVWLETEAPSLPWTGNVRELERVMRKRVLGLATPASASPVQLKGPGGETLDIDPDILASKATEAKVIDWYMRRVLRATGDNYSRAADILKVDRATIRRRLDKKESNTDADE